MTRQVRRLAASVVGALLLTLIGARASVAGPPPIEPEFAPTTSPAPMPGEPDFAERLRWMLDGAAIMLALTAIALAVVVWRRWHAATQPPMPARGSS